jgi:hypothetical protein
MKCTNPLSFVGIVENGILLICQSPVFPTPTWLNYFYGDVCTIQKEIDPYPGLFLICPGAVMWRAGPILRIYRDWSCVGDVNKSRPVRFCVKLV